MLKYGINNFYFETIATCKTLDDANYIEEICISQYNSFNKGYNDTTGGHAPKATRIAKEKIKRGEDTSSAKLTILQVKQILKLNEYDNLSASQIGKIMNVGKGCILSVLNGKSWSHITGIKHVATGILRGEAVKKSKLTASKIKYIVELYSKGGVSQNEIAKEMGVSYGCIEHILIGHTWAHITGIKHGETPIRNQKGEEHYKAKITKEQVLQVVDLINKGIQLKIISQQLGIGYYSVKDISRGKSWRSITGFTRKSK